MGVLKRLVHQGFLTNLGQLKSLNGLGLLVEELDGSNEGFSEEG
jgi:hypothetical protein